MIDPALAQKWIDNYAKDAAPGAITAEFFGFRRISELLGQGDAIGLRIYYAKDDEGKQRLILIAASPEEKNLAKVDGSGTAGMVLDQGLLCPPYCPPK